MPSKLLCIFTLALAFSGCSLRLNDKVEKAPLNVSLGGGCLSNSGKILSRFAEGSATAAELEGFWDCTEKSVTTFNSHTEGDTLNSYKANDLARFLSKYFLNGKEIPPGLINEVMVLKQSILGGRSDEITRKELNDVLRIMKVARRVTARLRPHMPVRAETFITRSYSKDQFEEAIVEFQAGMNEIAESLKDTQGAYSFDHFGALFTELGKFLYPDNKGDSEWVKTVLNWTQALRPAKAIFVSPPKDEILAADWFTIYRMAPRYYSLYLRARFYSHGEHNYAYGPGLLRLESLFDDSIQLFSQVLDQRREGEIKSEEIDELLVAMNSAGMLGGMEFDTVRAGVKLVFGKLFRVEDTGKGYTIRKENFAQLSRTFHFATEGLRALEAIYRAKFGENGFETQGLKTEDFASFTTEHLLESTLLRDQVSRAAVESLVKTAGEINTVFPGRSLHVLIPSGKNRPKLSLQHMAKMHLMRSVNRLLIGAYAGPKADSLTEAQLKSLLDDIFPILRDPKVKLADAETQESFPKRLFEASLFLPSSDGDKGLTMNEAIEFESLLLSTIYYANTVHNNLALACGTAAENGKFAIKARCFRKNWLKQASLIWSSIPGTAQYFKQLTDRNQEVLFTRLENFLRKGRSAEDNFTISDTRAFILLPYYVELLFARFDRNHDGLLENEEAELAYPVFLPFLKEKCIERGKPDPKDHHAIYMYLLANRSLPTAENWGEAISYAWRRYVAGDKAFKADRGQVVEIFEKLLTL
ncbi:MAG: hypothetical protein AB7K68_10670 [Bacteriovoracia bacterium]